MEKVTVHRCHKQTASGSKRDSGTRPGLPCERVDDETADDGTERAGRECVGLRVGTVQWLVLGVVSTVADPKTDAGAERYQKFAIAADRCGANLRQEIAVVLPRGCDGGS